MITTNGKRHIKRYLAGYVPAIARCIALGIAPTAEAVGQTKLGLEVLRVDVNVVSYDFVNNKLIFKGTVPDTFVGTVYEAGLYSREEDSNAGFFGSALLTSFDSVEEIWADATTSVTGTYTTASRVGLDSLRHTPAASGTKTDVLSNLNIDLSGYSGADKFVFGFNVGNGNTSSIRFRFGTDNSNYYEFVVSSPSAGYKVVEFDKSTAVVTGSPNWNSITQIRVSTISTAGGASLVDYDAIRIDDADTINEDYVMVARKVLSTPFVKQQGKEQEIEFALDVTV